MPQALAWNAVSGLRAKTINQLPSSPLNIAPNCSDSKETVRGILIIPSRKKRKGSPFIQSVQVVPRAAYSIQIS